MPRGAIRSAAPERRGGGLRAAAFALTSTLARAPALVVVAAQPACTAASHGTRVERYVAIEAGAAAQNLLLRATALGLGGTIVGAFDDAALRTNVDLAQSAHRPRE